MEHLFFMFLDHTQRRTTVGRTPLDEWSARRRDLYLTTHDTHNRQISMRPVGFELTISAGERPQAARLLRSWVLPTVLRRCVWSRNIKNGCSIYIYIYDISRLRVKFSSLQFIKMTYFNFKVEIRFIICAMLLVPFEAACRFLTYLISAL